MKIGQQYLVELVFENFNEDTDSIDIDGIELELKHVISKLVTSRDFRNFKPRMVNVAGVSVQYETDYEVKR